MGRTGYLSVLCRLPRQLTVLLLLLLNRGFGMWSLVPIGAGLIGSGTRFGPILLCADRRGQHQCLGHRVRLEAGGCRPGPSKPHALSSPFGIRHCPLPPSELACIDIPIGPTAAQPTDDAILHMGIPWSPGEVLPGSDVRPPRVPSRNRDGHLDSPPMGSVGPACFAQHCRKNGAIPAFAPVWQGIILVWFISLIAFIVALVIGPAWYRQRISAQECHMLLQDIMWKENRHEQRRITRWRVWARLRQAAGEQPQ